MVLLGVGGVRSGPCGSEPPAPDSQALVQRLQGGGVGKGQKGGKGGKGKRDKEQEDAKKVRGRGRGGQAGVGLPGEVGGGTRLPCGPVPLQPSPGLPLPRGLLRSFDALCI